MVYIVFEGIVGSGKSTQSKRLVEYLKQNPPNPPYQGGTQPEIVYVREPGSTPIAEDIRYLAQKKEWEKEIMHPLTNAYLYAAARAQTIQTVVLPALQSGKIVVSDRSFLSSLAQQGYVQGLGIDTVYSINQAAIERILPDIVFFMDIDVESALLRAYDTAGDKWEKMGKDFFQDIVDGYDMCEKLEIMENKFIRIDARGTEDEVFDRICSYLGTL